MADKDETIPGTKIEGEETGSSLNPGEQEKQETEVKRQARERNWKPYNEWVAEGKDPSLWISAKEFMGRQSLFDKIESLKTAMFQKDKTHERQLTEIRKYIADLSDREYKKALADLKAQRRSAMREGEVERVEAIEEQIDTVQQERAKTVTQQTQEQQTSPETNPIYQGWLTENKWYGEDGELRTQADAFGAAYAKSHPEAQSNPQLILDYVTKMVKKANPDKFTTATQRRTNAVESGKSVKKTDDSVIGGVKLELSWDDLTNDQRKIARTVVDSGVLNDRAAKNKITPRQQYLIDLQSRLQSA